MIETEMGVDTALLLALDDMPALPCESRSHNDPDAARYHDDGPATHYAQCRHVCGPNNKKLGEVYALCAKRAARIRDLEATGKSVLCMDCGQKFRDSTDWVVVLGPVRGRRGK